MLNEIVIETKYDRQYRHNDRHYRVIITVKPVGSSDAFIALETRFIYNNNT